MSRFAVSYSLLWTQDQVDNYVNKFFEIYLAKVGGGYSIVAFTQLKATNTLADMSLLDGLILDGALNPPVVTQEIWLAIRTDGATGAGTEDDPYNCYDITTAADPRFDQVMRTIGATVSSSNPVTIRLQPGEYITRGYALSYGPTTGWQAKSWMRICGSGIGISILTLATDVSSTSQISLVGCDPASFLENIALEDVTLKASRTVANQANVVLGGVRISGKNVFIRRVEVRDFGSKGSLALPCLAISVANALTGYEPYNCVVDRCLIRYPGGTTVDGTVGIHLGSSNSLAYHRMCVVRDCFLDFSASNGAYNLADNYMGIQAGEGIGMGVASNQIRNCRYGISWGGWAGGVNATSDLRINGNSLSNVAEAFNNPQSNGTIDRLIVTNNVVEWPSAADYANAIGLKLDGGSGSSTTLFKSVVALGNVFRRPAGTSPNNSEIGLSFKNCTTVVVENNIADVGTAIDKVVSYSVCGSLKAFSNKKADATFAAAYNTATLLHLGELTTDVEDALLVI